MDSILVVDDEHSVRELLHSILSRRHWAATASSAEEALDMLGRDHYGLLITDLRMTGMDGLELIGEATRRQPGLKTMLVSGFVSDEVTRRAIRLGASAVLEKPFDSAQLVGIVDALLAEIHAAEAGDATEAAAG